MPGAARKALAVLLSLALQLGPAGLSVAEVPRRLSYRGTLADNLGRPVSGSHSFRVKLYSASTGGSLLYTEDFASGDAASVFNGIYELEIGSVTGTVPASVFDGDQLWLELDVKAGTSLSGAETLLPRQRLASEAFAFHARTAEYLGTGAFISTHSATGDLNVPGTVTAAAFSGDGAALTNVPPTGAAGGDLSGNYPNPAVVDDSHQHSNASLTGIAASKVAAGSFASGLYDFPGSLGIGTASPSGLFQVGGGTLTATALGRVGVGTTVPTQALQVIGTVAATDLTCTDCLAAGDLGANSVGASELAATAVTAGTYGDATTVGRFTVDADGRLTGVSSTTISGVSPGGAAGGDLSGSYPNPSVSDDSHSHSDATLTSISASEVLAGAFAAGSYSYPGSLGIGTAAPEYPLQVNGHLSTMRSSVILQPSGGSIATDGTYGVYWHTSGASPSGSYGIYRTAGAWTANTYQQLMIQFDTGIQLGAGTGVGTGYDKSYVEVLTGKGLMVTSGNVGIGTTNPTEGRLETLGSTGTTALSQDASARTMARFNNNTAARAGSLYVLGTNVPASDSIALLSNQSAGSGLTLAARDAGGTARGWVFLTGDGNVGIGSAAPSNNLDILGGLNLTGSINTGQGYTELYAMDQPVRTTDSPTFGGLTVNGAVGGTGFSAWDQNASNDIVSGTAAGGDLSGTYPSPTIGANAVALATDTTGNYVATVSAGTGIGVAGSGIENAAVTVSVAADSLNFSELADVMAVDAPSQIDLSANKLTFNVNSTGNLVVAASGVDTHAFNSSGQVGIGTTVPGFTLQVNGSAGGTAFSAWDQNASNDIVSGSAAGGDLAGTYPSPSVADDSHFHSDSTLSSISASEVISGSFSGGTYNFPGSLGVGTASPGQLFEVVKTAVSNINPTAALKNTGAGSASSLRFEVSGGGGYALGMTSSGQFALSSLNTNIDLSTDFLRVTSAGNVGIGSFVPGSRLDVAGTAQLRGAGGLTGLVVNSSGNVGIGIDPSTSYLLRVRGNPGNWSGLIENTGNASQVYFANPGGYGAYIDAGTNAGSGTYALNVNRAGSSYLYVRGDGLVGINTTVPSQSLDVIGSMRATGNFLLPNGYILFEGSAGGYTTSDAWIADQGYLELKPRGSSWGVVLRDQASTNYLNLEAYGTYGSLGHNTSDGPLYFDASNLGIGTNSLGTGYRVNLVSATYGIRAENTSSDSADDRMLWAEHNAAPYYGVPIESHSGYIAVNGNAFTGGTGVRYGVFGSASGGASGNYGVYYSGGLNGSGTKTALVRTSHGPLAMYAMESPENWFEDLGRGRLSGGAARVELDPVFLETVTVDEAHPLLVFVQLTGNCPGGVYVEKESAAFTVRTHGGAACEAGFDWRAVASRRGFEDMRMEVEEGAYGDPHLYPEHFDWEQERGTPVRRTHIKPQVKLDLTRTEPERLAVNERWHQEQVAKARRQKGVDPALMAVPPVQSLQMWVRVEPYVQEHLVWVEPSEGSFRTDRLARAEGPGAGR